MQKNPPQVNLDSTDATQLLRATNLPLGSFESSAMLSKSLRYSHIIYVSFELGYYIFKLSSLQYNCGCCSSGEEIDICNALQNVSRIATGINNLLYNIYPKTNVKKQNERVRFK